MADVKSGSRLALTVLGAIVTISALATGLLLLGAPRKGGLVLGVGITLVVTLLLLATVRWWAKWFFAVCCLTTLRALVMGFAVLDQLEGRHGRVDHPGDTRGAVRSRRDRQRIYRRQQRSGPPDRPAPAGGEGGGAEAAVTPREFPSWTACSSPPPRRWPWPPTRRRGRTSWSSSPTTRAGAT